MKSKSTFISYSLTLVGVAIITASIVFFFSGPLTEDASTEPQQPPLQEPPTAKSDRPAKEINVKVEAPLNMNSDLSENGELEETEETEEIRLWAISETIDDNAPPLNPAIHDPLTIELSPEWSSQFQEFDEVTLPLPHDDIVVVVEKRTVFPNGDISWNGHLSGYEDQYPVMITVGKTSSFGTITTPNGEYTVEINGSTGTVYKTPRVDQLSADGSPDFLIPDEAQ
ncbi:MAG: hypothetical protein JKY67_11670 [Pseudomonadales bacterium]|nr:hypothetical protein [Pseudomonadales bacterium]